MITALESRLDSLVRWKASVDEAGDNAFADDDEVEEEKEEAGAELRISGTKASTSSRMME